MANLTESPIYETGIFQLEKSTPALGGAPVIDSGVPSAGHANAQAQQLANRTAWLKERVDSGGSASSLAANLANASDSDKGAALIGYNGGTVAGHLAAIAELETEVSTEPAANKILRADETGVIADGWLASTVARLVNLGLATGASLIGYAHVSAGAVVRSIADRFKTKVNVLDFGVVVGSVSWAQAEANQISINKASAYAVSIGAGILEFPAGDIWVRRLAGNDGTQRGDSYCLLRSNVQFKGAGVYATRIVRAGPTTPFSVDPLDMVKGAAIRDMTIWGNPGVDNYTHYPADLVYLENCKDVLIDNVIFLDAPGLHAIDVNSTDGLKISRCHFLGYDLSLRGADTSYYPECIQVGMDPDATAISKNIRVSHCKAGPSDNYQAPLVFMGNHTGGGGGPEHAVENVIIEDVIGVDLVNYMFRPKAWKNVSIIRSRLESGTARFAYLDYKPAYPDAGTTFAACENISLIDCYHNGDGEYLYTSVMGTTEDPLVRHRGIKVIGGEVVGRAATNAVSAYYTAGLLVDRLKVRGSRRALAAYWCEDVTVLNPDWDGMEVNGLEITDHTGYGRGKGFNKNLTVRGGRITNSKTYAMYIGAQNGYLIDGVDVSGSVSLTGVQAAILLLSGTNNGVVRNVVGKPNGNNFYPAVGVSIISGDNNVVEDCDIYCAGEMVTNNGTGKSGEVRKIYWVSALPSSGSWRKGDVAKNINLAMGAPTGWLRLTTGSGNALGSDWHAEPNLT